MHCVLLIQLSQSDFVNSEIVQIYQKYFNLIIMSPIGLGTGRY
jgi:hypothetical protein